MTLVEQFVKEVWTNPSGFTHDQCRAADNWIRDQALEKLEEKLSNLDKRTRDYIILMTRAHFGSMEVDAFLMGLDCYPEWLESTIKDTKICGNE